MTYSWRKTLSKALQWALVTGLGGAAVALQQAPEGADLDLGALGMAALAAVLAGAAKGAQNWRKHRRKGTRPWTVTSLSVLLPLVLLACSGGQLQRHEALLELATRAATARVLAERPEWRPTVVDIATGAQALLEADPEIALAELEQYVVNRIPWDNLLPEERALALTALGAIRQEITNALEARGLTDPDAARIQVAQVLAWIRQTAAL